MGETAYSEYEDILEDTYVDEDNSGGSPPTQANFGTLDSLLIQYPPDEMTAFVRFVIPKPSGWSVALPENAIVRGLELKLTRVTASGSHTVTARSCIVPWVEALATWHSSSGPIGSSGIVNWYPEVVPASGETAAYVRTLGSVSTTAATDYTLDLTPGVKLEEYDWGSKVNLMLSNSNTTAVEFRSSEHADTPQFRVLYEIPTPPGPSITVTPQDNGIDGYINITKHSTDHTRYQAVHQDNSATVTFSSGDHSAIITDTAQDQFDTTSFDTGGANPLATEDRNVAFTVYAEDGINTENNGGKGNVVVVARPNIASSTGYTGHTDSSDPAGSGGTTLTSAQADIGDDVAIVVVGDTTTPPSGGSQGYFKHVYVNWDSGASDTDADYTKYTLDEPATTTAGNVAMTHRYSTALLKTIKVQIEDKNGWRSDKTALTTQQPIPPEANPVAALTTSRTKVLAANYGEKNAALVLSGQQSHPVGSDRKIANYLFSYEGGKATTIATANAYNNDNSVFDSGSKRVAMISLGADSMNTTKFKIFGIASFTSDGTTPVADTATTFSLYRQAVGEITIDGDRTTGASATEFVESQAGTPNYWKAIDCVMCTAVDANDDGDRYALRVFSTDDDVTFNSVFNTPINTELRWKSNPTSTNKSLKYSWGGFTKLGSGNYHFQLESEASDSSGLVVASGVGTITKGGDWDMNPQVGDYIHINSDDNDYDEYAICHIRADTYFKYKTDKPDKSGMTATVTSHRLVANTLGNGSDDYFLANEDYCAAGLYVGDIIKLSASSQGADFVTPKYYKIAALSSLSAITTLFDRLFIERDATKLTKEEQAYITTAIVDNDGETDVNIARHNPNPSLTVALFNTASPAEDDNITFTHGVIDDDTTGFTENFGDTTQVVRMAQPANLDLDTLVNDGSIAIESATLNRSGGIGGTMSLGESRYPTNVVRTQMGLPKITVKLHVLTQAGLRDIFSLVEGDRFDYVFLDSRKVDSPTTAYRQYRMKLESGSLAQDGSSANRYIANCTFIVVGEDVS